MSAIPEDMQRPRAASTPGGVVPRIVARVIDAVILGVVGGAVGLAMDFNVLWLVLQAVLVFAYFVVLDVAWGTTPGKRLLGLRVTGPDGARPTTGQAAAREAFTLLGAIPFAGPLLALIAWIVIVVTVSKSPQGQGAHDTLAGGTRVVTG
jgi:uncharacterized RDD family membrane protein YckC